MMRFELDGEKVLVIDYCDYKSCDRVYGHIQEAEDGGYVYFHTSDSPLTTRQLHDIFEYQRDLNRAR